MKPLTPAFSGPTNAAFKQLIPLSLFIASHHLQG